MDKDLSIIRYDSGIELDETYEKTSFLDLPAEVRTNIYEHLFDSEESRSLAFHKPEAADSLNEEYYASDYLSPLLTCRQFTRDAQLLAFSRTTFVIRNPFTAKTVSARLSSRLSPQQIASVRSIAFIAEADHFRQMRNWQGHAFGVPQLHLDSLTFLLYRSSYWHYLFDFNTIVIDLLRGLDGVKSFEYVKNGSRVKPFFHTWFNRLCGAMLKRDVVERFGTGATVASIAALRVPPADSKTKAGYWWDWEFDLARQTAKLIRGKEIRAGCEADEYEAWVEPFRQELRKSIEAEEYDPDPMSRNGFV